MDSTTTILSIALAAVIAGFAGYLLWAQRKLGELEAAGKGHADTFKLTLNAYERLTLLAERTRLNNLVNRLYDANLSAREMQQLLIQHIREEYEHNLTQQLFVKPELWQAITKMKEQNMYIINQLARLEPAQATALDLNKKILDFVLNNPDATMNSLVLEALQYEVKSLMQ